MTKMNREAVLLFGGPSEERLVSVASAQNVLANAPFSLLPWFIDRNLRVHQVDPETVLRHQNPFTQEFAPRGAGVEWESALSDLAGRQVLIALHGTWGEDGSLQESLERVEAIFSGSDAASCRLAFDKVGAKAQMSAAGFRVPAAIPLDPNAGWDQLPGLFVAYGAFVIKPIRNGSSIGLHCIRSAAAAAATRPTGDVADYIGEAMIIGREFTVGVWEGPEGLKALPVSEVRMVADGDFDYSGKYLGKGSTEITPAPIEPALAAELQEIACQAHRRCGCRGYSRSDILLDAVGPAFLEVNTHPGLSKASFIPQQLAAAGIAFKDFLAIQLDQAARVSRDRSPLRR